MSFINPLMLFGLFAVSVPIIIHLIHRRRAQRRPFSAVEFVVRSRRAVQKKFRLKQLILLILRCLFLGALAFALAKPLAGALASGTIVEGPAAVVVLIDRSMSMQVDIGGNSAFDEAAQRADELIKGLAPESEAAIILFDDRTQDLTGGLTADRNVLTEALEKLEIGWRGTDVGAALDAAQNLLTRSDQPRKVAIVLTDLTARGWKGTRERVPVSENPGDKILWRIVDVTDGKRTENLVASDLAFAEEPGASLAVTLSANSYATEIKSGVLCELTVDNKPAGRGFVDLEPGGTAQKRFTIGSPAPGVHRAAARVGVDGLPVDDVRYLTFRGRARLRALIVDGDPTTLLREAESFYLERALLPRRGLAGDLAPVVIDAEGLATSDLNRFDVLVLANVSEIPSPTAKRIREFVSRGGGLMFAMGDRVKPSQLNGLFNDLLPMRVRGWRDTSASATGAKQFHIQAFPSEHPVLRVFHGKSLDVFKETPFMKVALLERPTAAAKTLLKFSDGSPALVEHPFGRGKVMLFASTMDRGWNDLSIATVYLPLFRRSVRYLGGDLEAGGAGEAMVGKPHRIAVGKRYETVRLVGPAETDITELGVVDGIAEYTAEKPGFYAVQKPDGSPDPELQRRAFAANVEVEEGDLRKLPADQLVELLGDNLEVAGAPTPDGAGGANRPFWGMLLLLGVAALFAEGVLTR